MVGMKYLMFLLMLACAPLRNTIADQTIARGVGQPGEQRCNNNVPEAYIVADNVGRWYPLHPRAADGSIAPCAVCVVEQRIARCR